MARDVRFGSLADIRKPIEMSAYCSKANVLSVSSQCPLSAISGLFITR
jgi:hypothetical protein